MDTYPSVAQAIQAMGEIAISLIAAAIGGILSWLGQWLLRKRRRHKRLEKLREAAHGDDVALCLRVGGMGDPVPDVLKYLRDKHPAIKQLIVYRISSQEAKSRAGQELDAPAVANRVIEDVLDGIREYGRGEIRKLHLFPAGMIAYQFSMSPIINWGKVIVYHRTSDSYVPLYELSKDVVHKGKNEFQQLAEWEVMPIGDTLPGHPPAHSLESE